MNLSTEAKCAKICGVPYFLRLQLVYSLLAFNFMDLLL